MTVKIESEVAQSCLTLRDPMDCNPPGSSVHGIFQAKVLEWGAIAFSSYRPLEQLKIVRHSSPQEFYSLVDDTVEKAMAPHSSTLAWKIPWTEEPGRL